MTLFCEQITLHSESVSALITYVALSQAFINHLLEVLVTGLVSWNYITDFSDDNCRERGQGGPLISVR